MASRLPSADSREAMKRYRRWVSGVALVMLLAGGLSLWTWREGADQRALRQMAPVDRGALYEEASRYADALCAAAETEGSLQSRCTDAAEFLLDFPECDDACRERVRAHIREPAR